jgi:hypothetical protein
MVFFKLAAPDTPDLPIRYMRKEYMNFLKLLKGSALLAIGQSIGKSIKNDPRELSSLNKTVMATTATGVILISIVPALGFLVIPMAFIYAEIFSRKK